MSVLFRSSDGKLLMEKEWDRPRSPGIVCKLADDPKYFQAV